MDEPLKYALVENGTVTNVIWLCGSNAGDFPNAVCVSDRPVTIGDQYADGVFTRDGEAVPTFAEIEAEALAAAEAAEEPEE